MLWLHKILPFWFSVNWEPKSLILIWMHCNAQICNLLHIFHLQMWQVTYRFNTGTFKVKKGKMLTTQILTRMSNSFDKQQHVIKSPYEWGQVRLMLLHSGNLPSTQKMQSALQKEGGEFLLWKSNNSNLLNRKYSGFMSLTSFSWQMVKKDSFRLHAAKGFQ